MPGRTLLIGFLATGALIGWSMKRAHGSWTDYQEGRAKVPRLRTRFFGSVGSAVRWGVLAVILVVLLLHWKG
jgi:hypothetical protein